MHTQSAISTNERQTSNTRPAVLGTTGRLLSAYDISAFSEILQLHSDQIRLIVLIREYLKLSTFFFLQKCLWYKGFQYFGSLSLNSTNFDTYKIIPDYIKHHLQKSHGILKKMLAFLCEVYYNRDILNPRKQGFVWH